MAILGFVSLLLASLFWYRERSWKALLSDTKREYENYGRHTEERARTDVLEAQQRSARLEVAADDRVRKVQDEGDERCRKLTSDAEARAKAAEERARKVQGEGDERYRKLASDADTRVKAAEERARKVRDEGDERCRKLTSDADARVKAVEEARSRAEERYAAEIDRERAKWLALGVAAGGKEMKVCVFKGKRTVTGVFVKTHQQAMLIVGLYQHDVKFLHGDISDLTQYGIPPEIRKAIDTFLCVAEVTGGVPPVLKLVK
jgi:hypothetical protein